LTSARVRRAGLVVAAWLVFVFMVNLLKVNNKQSDG
jgi:hypothetical protein